MPHDAIGRRRLNLLIVCFGLFAGTGMLPAGQLRIVSFAPGVTELVCRLGGESQLVGITRYCIPPAELRHPVEIVGGIVDPNWERLIRSEPELILVSEMMPEAATRRMRKLLPAAQIEMLKYNDWEALKQEIVRLGEWMGRQEEAQELLEQFAAAENRIINQKLPPLRTVVLYGFLQTEAAGRGSFPDQILQKLGLKNIAATNDLSAWPRLSLEFLLQQDPQLLILPDPAPSAERARWADEVALNALRSSVIWRQLSAVKQGQVVLLPLRRLQVPDSKMLDTLLELHALLMGEATLETDD